MSTRDWDDFLRPYLFCCGYTQSFAHLHTYCKGRLSDRKRKTAEPMALAAGGAVCTLQEFLRDHLWQFDQVRQPLQGHVADVLPTLPAADLGTVGLIDETSALKAGTKTPGVQRQYLGCVGKIANGIVTVHLGVWKGRYKTLIDAELFLSPEWAADPERRTEAGIPRVRLASRTMRGGTIRLCCGTSHCLLMLSVVAEPTERLRGEKPGADHGASVQWLEPNVRGMAGVEAGDEPPAAPLGHDRRPPVAEPGGAGGQAKRYGKGRTRHKAGRGGPDKHRSLKRPP